MSFVNYVILFLGPGGLFYFRIEMVMPAFSTLLAYAALQVLCDYGPSFGAILMHQLYHLLGGNDKLGKVAVLLVVLTLIFHVSSSFAALTIQ